MARHAAVRDHSFASTHPTSVSIHPDSRTPISQLHEAPSLSAIMARTVALCKFVGTISLGLLTVRLHPPVPRRIHPLPPC